MHHKAQTLVAVGVLEADQLLTHRHLDRQFFNQFAPNCGFDRLFGLLLATGEFPQPAQQPLIQPLINQHLAGRIEHHPHANHLEGERF